jgi:hypothetical protein
VRLREQVVDGNLDGRLGAEVLEHRVLDQLDDVIQVADVLALDRGQDHGADRLDDRAVRFTRDDGRGRRAAEAAVARVRLEDDDDILHVVHGAQCRLERRLQGNPELAEFKACYFHDVASVAGAASASSPGMGGSSTSSSSSSCSG